jgi:hypothetical protein
VSRKEWQNNAWKTKKSYLRVGYTRSASRGTMGWIDRIGLLGLLLRLCGSPAFALRVGDALARFRAQHMLFVSLLFGGVGNNRGRKFNATGLLQQLARLG